MSPRPAKGEAPKGPQPVISFRVPREVMKLVSEIRALEPHAEPDLIPKNVRSDADFARWVFLENISRLHRRLIAQMRIKDLVLEYLKLDDKQDFTAAMFEKGRIDKQAKIDVTREIESEKCDIVYKIDVLCRKNLINPPEGFRGEDPSPYVYIEPDDISENEDIKWCEFLGMYLWFKRFRQDLTSKNRQSIFNFASRFGMNLGDTGGEVDAIANLLDPASPIRQYMHTIGCGFTPTDATRLQGRLQELNSGTREGPEDHPARKESGPDQTPHDQI